MSTYRVYIDGLEYELTEASRTQLLIDGRAEFTPYSVEIFAEDQSDNISTSSLVANIRTLDTSPPLWGSNAQIEITR